MRSGRRFSLRAASGGRGDPQAPGFLPIGRRLAFSGGWPDVFLDYTEYKEYKEYTDWLHCVPWTWKMTLLTYKTGSAQTRSYWNLGPAGEQCLSAVSRALTSVLAMSTIEL